MSDFTYQGEDFEEKVRKQVEFYFSDSNLQTDKFLYKIYEANDGWVELKTLMTFGRMRQFRPEEKVIAALKNSEKLVLSANDELISRKDPLKDLNELKTIRKRNTVHIEGFPHELSQEEVEAWFNDKIGPILPKEKTGAFNSIRRIRTRQDKKFFGVVDVEFKTSEDSEFFLKEIEVSYPEGVVEAQAPAAPKESEEESAATTAPASTKETLKKMSFLTFQEMRENGKRFGVNDVTKRRNSFNENRGKKFNNNKRFRKDTETPKEEAKEEAKEETKEEIKEETKVEAKVEAKEPAAEAA